MVLPQYWYVVVLCCHHDKIALHFQKLKNFLSFCIAASKCCSRNCITTQILKERKNVNLTFSI